MKSFNLKIRPNKEKNDLTIIYKEGENNFHEIKTSKKEILQTLRYYQKKSNEINQMGLLYIQENIPFNIFQRFISSVITQEINIDESNYDSFLYLSRKYEYEELQREIEDFIKERPDICSLVDDLTTTKNDDSDLQSSENEIKEEIIAKNLDISIKNKILHKLPIQTINRILNSPKKVIKDHKLLFSFVIETIKKNLNESNDKNTEDLENILILPSSLDYCSMSSIEIEELFEVENSMNFFQPKNSTEKIKEFIEFEKEMKMKVDSLEERIIQNENLYENEMKKMKKLIEENKKQLNELLTKNKEEIAIKLDDYQRDLNMKIEEQKSQIAKNEETINQVKNNLSQSDIILNQVKLMNDQFQIKKEKNESDIKKIPEIVQKDVTSINCENGIFQYLFDKYKGNPVDKGLIEITGNSINNGNQKLLPKIVDPNWNVDDWWISNNESNSYVKINFQNSKIQIFKYRIRVGCWYGEYLFKSWILKGMNEDNQEIILDKVDNSNQITSNKPEAEIQIQNKNIPFVSSIILVMKGRSSYGDLSMRLRNIELYGNITT